MQKLNIVLVPSTGNLYIYTNPWCGTKNDDEFSSPPRGIYISTVKSGYFSGLSASSRPLHGESIYLQTLEETKKAMSELFSSPPRGIYISTNMKGG